MENGYPQYSAQGVLHDAVETQLRMNHECGMRNAIAPRQPPEEGSVPVTIREISAAVDNLERELASMENRLELVLSPPVPRVGDPSAKEQASSPMHERLLAVLHRVRVLTCAIQSTNSRITL